MNKEEVKKALECCKDMDKCDVCPYFSSVYCIQILKKYALQLINEQEAEIERLKAENEKRLTCDFVKTAQKQAVKEFAEKLKRKCHNYYPSIDHYCCSEKAVNVKDINELLKEYEK